MTTERVSARSALVGRCLAWSCVITLLFSSGCAKKEGTTEAVGATKAAAPKATAKEAPATQPAKKPAEPDKKPAESDKKPSAMLPGARPANPFGILARMIQVPRPRLLVRPDEVTEVMEVEIVLEDAFDKNLTNEDIGNDPDLPTNYNIDRIEDVSVPGPVNPNEAVGIKNTPEKPRK